MSNQIAQSLGKCMNSFISQIDGQKPVANNQEFSNMEQMAGSYNGMADDPSESVVKTKGDVSQQIMETHGQRIKKYGIYIDQLVDKLKGLHTHCVELFETIASQSSGLIEGAAPEKTSSYEMTEE